MARWYGDMCHALLVLCVEKFADAWMAWQNSRGHMWTHLRWILVVLSFAIDFLVGDIAKNMEIEVQLTMVVRAKACKLDYKI